ncbi:MAG: hypothetical protein C0425_03390 [Chlorobiaceae bacterium]|nr:hypothetical protein [Chlorobiaceae bacterium]MBA4309359.1 hypothetical protein [Chlorobiaceae bacterium]
MMIAVDIGNSTFKFGFIKDGEFTDKKVITKLSYSDLAFLKKIDHEAIYIASVVPKRTIELTDILVNDFQIIPKLITTNSKFSFSIEYKNINSLGVDRMCGIEGALFYLNNLGVENNFSIVTIDVGTAVTINYLNDENKFSGGIISPGPYTMVKSLRSGTAQLPFVKLDNYVSILGHDTHSSIASGVINSVVGLIERVDKYFQGRKIKNIKYFLTGGNALAIKEHLSLDFTHIPHLNFLGIYSVYLNEKQLNGD